MPKKSPRFGCFVSTLLLGSALAAPSPAPRPLRPATITWGGYSHLEQLQDADAAWPFVQKWMDGLILHGMYWVNRIDYTGRRSDAEWTNNVAALGKALRRHGKTASIETGLHETERGYDPNEPGRRYAWAQSTNLVALLRYLAGQGVTVSMVRPD